MWNKRNADACVVCECAETSKKIRKTSSLISHSSEILLKCPFPTVTPVKCDSYQWFQMSSHLLLKTMLYLIFCFTSKNTRPFASETCYIFGVWMDVLFIATVYMFDFYFLQFAPRIFFTSICTWMCGDAVSVSQPATNECVFKRIQHTLHFTTPNIH